MLSHGGIFPSRWRTRNSLSVVHGEPCSAIKGFPSRWRTRNSLSVVHREPCSAMGGFFPPGGGLEIPCQLYMENYAQPWSDFSFQVED